MQHFTSKCHTVHTAACIFNCVSSSSATVWHEGKSCWSIVSLLIWKVPRKTRISDCSMHMRLQNSNTCNRLHWLRRCNISDNEYFCSFLWIYSSFTCVVIISHFIFVLLLYHINEIPIKLSELSYVLLQDR